MRRFPTACCIAFTTTVFSIEPEPAAEQANRPYAATEQREPCAAYNPLREAYFGDTHVHTAYSQDASTQGTRNTPFDAYRFAKGETLGIQPYNEEDKPQRTQRISRPLDFTAITDHAEQFGEVRICNTPGLEGYNNWVCRVYRRWPRVAFYMMNMRASVWGTRWAYCGENGENCLQEAASVWQDTQDAAEQAYDRSSGCEFTSFNAYEWTGVEDRANNMHRNVIFRNNNVMKLPVSFIEANTPNKLWAALDEQCVNGTPGCEVLVIPHNSNLSSGSMFKLTNDSNQTITAADAKLRRQFEVLVEMMQHKGSSECYYGAFGDVAVDELCAFEYLPYDNFAAKFSSKEDNEPQPTGGYIREVLRNGLREEQKLGVNPFKMGFVASTDTHIAAPGAVEEDLFQGHGGAGLPAAEEAPPGLPDKVEYNAGGLAVLYAEENTRDALFAAMQRREAYGTSGSRIKLRFFGGWDYSLELCEQADLVAQGYANGVPMGGDLPARTNPDAPPSFVVSAARDPLVGMPLQRVQIIKSWVDGNGKSQESIYEVAGNPDNGASVDTSTCNTSGAGSSNLCSVWRDPEFDGKQSAYYYARVVENPGCRWSQHICVANKVNCSDPGTIGEGLEPCCAAEHRPVVHERAWSSPIWYRSAATP